MRCKYSSTQREFRAVNTYIKNEDFNNLTEDNRKRRSRGSQSKQEEGNNRLQWKLMKQSRKLRKNSETNNWFFGEINKRDKTN